jgi:2-polyprenyl-3-methyl-5-hydroxy-6-metoxy-1,4-benzoquinol methylase
VTAEHASYFKHRRVSADSTLHYAIPVYLEPSLPVDCSARILDFDFACGFRQFVSALGGRGYRAAVGHDIEPAAIAHCESHGIAVIDGNEIALGSQSEFDFIFSSHVLEHLPKADVVATLEALRSMLKAGGALFVCLPNAQSNTGCYGAYEDFTHHTLFTSGSLYYVLGEPGFAQIELVDANCTAGMRPRRRRLKRRLLTTHMANYRSWNRATGSAIHPPSPEILSNVIKAIAQP